MPERNILVVDQVFTHSTWAKLLKERFSCGVDLTESVEDASAGINHNHGAYSVMVIDPYHFSIGYGLKRPDSLPATMLVRKANLNGIVVVVTTAPAPSRLEARTSLRMPEDYAFYVNKPLHPTDFYATIEKALETAKHV